MFKINKGETMTTKQIKKAIKLAEREIKEWQIFKGRMEQWLLEKELEKKSRFKKNIKKHL